MRFGDMAERRVGEQYSSSYAHGFCTSVALAKCKSLSANNNSQELLAPSLPPSVGADCHSLFGVED